VRRTLRHTLKFPASLRINILIFWQFELRHARITTIINIIVINGLILDVMVFVQVNDALVLKHVSQVRDQFALQYLRLAV
jgi:hypothetical protein